MSRVSGRHSRAHAARSLASRGGTLRTFGGLAIFAALVLLGSGGYLVREQFADPVRAEPVGLFVSALLIATGVTLLLCLVRPARKIRSKLAGRPTKTAPLPHDLPVAASRRRMLLWAPERREASFQSRFVDHARIRV